MVEKIKIIGIIIGVVCGLFNLTWTIIQEYKKTIKIVIKIDHAIIGPPYSYVYSINVCNHDIFDRKISMVAINRKGSKEMTVFKPGINYKTGWVIELPKTIKPKDSHEFMIPKDFVEGKLQLTKGDVIISIVRDSMGKRYKSKSIKI